MNKHLEEFDKLVAKHKARYNEPKRALKRELSSRLGAAWKRLTKYGYKPELTMTLNKEKRQDFYNAVDKQNGTFCNMKVIWV